MKFIFYFHLHCNIVPTSSFTKLLLKTVVLYIVPVICSLCNQSLQMGAFASYLKPASVYPYIESPDVLSSHRPVSNLGYPITYIFRILQIVFNLSGSLIMLMHSVCFLFNRQRNLCTMHTLIMKLLFVHTWYSVCLCCLCDERKFMIVTAKMLYLIAGYCVTSYLCHETHQ